LLQFLIVLLRFLFVVFFLGNPLVADPPLKSSKVSQSLDLMNLVKTYHPDDGARGSHGGAAGDNHDVVGY
jgi:hypothetical protein